MSASGSDDSRSCTFQTRLKSGVWQVTRNQVFYGDYLTRRDALHGACAAARAFEAGGGVAQVVAPPGQTIIAHQTEFLA